MIAADDTMICDVCSKAIDDADQHITLADGRVHIHQYTCTSRLPQWIWDDTDKYISAIMNSRANHKLELTIKDIVEDTDENIAMINDTRYYLFIDSSRTGPCVCVCNNFFKAVPCIIENMNNQEENIMAVLHRGKFWSVVTRLTVSMVDEDGNAITQKERR